MPAGHPPWSSERRGVPGMGSRRSAAIPSRASQHDRQRTDSPQPAGRLAPGQSGHVAGDQRSAGLVRQHTFSDAQTDPVGDGSGTDQGRLGDSRSADTPLHPPPSRGRPATDAAAGTDGQTSFQLVCRRSDRPRSAVSEFGWGGRQRRAGETLPAPPRSGAMVYPHFCTRSTLAS